jgi:hypothetical protein
MFRLQEVIEIGSEQSRVESWVEGFEEVESCKAIELMTK